MSIKRSKSWFLTEAGRRFTGSALTGVGIALSCANFSLHTFGLEKYKNFVHQYHNGKPVPLPNKLEERYKRCLDLLKIPEVHRKYVAPFSVFGFDLFNAGSWQSRYGGIVGIPVHFSYNSEQDVHRDIKVNQKNIDWESEDGKKLAESLILPEKVQEFAICREILSTRNIKVYLQSAYPFVCTFFAYNLSVLLNRRLNLYAAPVSLRAVMYSLTGTFSLGLYFLMQDFTETHYEIAIDKQLCELGPEFIDAGVVFYDKILKRNQALRELMGSEGQRKYSKLGNENFGLRQPRIALQHRKKFFESQTGGLETIENEETMFA